ncbi:MAG: type II secretion system protein [Sedimentisphaerales bacterium]|nr:type II secretion system protein [Sedimentisphaerales bacterium]
MNAFIFVELLVVVAVIGILFVVMVPVLSKAKDPASFINRIKHIPQHCLGTLLDLDGGDDFVRANKVNSCFLDVAYMNSSIVSELMNTD